MRFQGWLFPAEACGGPGVFGAFADFGQRYSAVYCREERFHCFHAKDGSRPKGHNQSRRRDGAGARVLHDRDGKLVENVCRENFRAFDYGGRGASVGGLLCKVQVP
jgi:hypothetical protein